MDKVLSSVHLPDEKYVDKIKEFLENRKSINILQLYTSRLEIKFKKDYGRTYYECIGKDQYYKHWDEDNTSEECIMSYNDVLKELKDIEYYEVTEPYEGVY